MLGDRGADGKSADKRLDLAAPRAGRVEVRRTAAQLRVELAPLRRRVADAEQSMKRLTSEIARIDAALAAPNLFGRDPRKATALAKARADAAVALKRAEDDWLAASAAYETASA